MKNILLLIIIIGCIAFLSYPTTRALFNDTATSSNNTFTTSDSFSGPIGTGTPTPTPTLTPTVTPTPTQGQAPSVESGDVVINELMWMGSSQDADDEWIELRNTTDHDIPIGGWQITKWVKSTSGDHEELMITITPDETISASSFFLIARFSDGDTKSILNVAPDMPNTSMVLNNSNLQIKLYMGNWDSGGMLSDTAGNKGAPLKGEHSSSHYSMERNSNFGDGTNDDNWHTATTSVGFDVGIEDDNKGTPKSANSSL